ncbi:MAG: hypothetical protein KME20_19190 [Kaiparowitsia implicata GSE-PSE-MK54-09C]|nr:hypothetical protein [Kaiparowitsia implicata GSE-PSE-MK54-09C]
MRYLAQVLKQDSDSSPSLQLLAHQKAEHIWITLNGDSVVLAPEAEPFNAGALVLVRLTTTQKVKEIVDAKDWVLDLVRQFLAIGLSPESLHQEVQRVEQWRQSLTMKSQELGRRSLELEARQDQIQQLEETLNREKQQLESRLAEADADETPLELEPKP